MENKNIKIFPYILQIVIIFAISLTIPGLSYPLTLDEAISLAKESLPSYKASLIGIRSTEALYDASLSPYLPSLEASTLQRQTYVSGDDFTTRSYDVTLSYTLFDGGNRWANRHIARLNLDISRETLRENLLSLVHDVKVAFYSVIALRDTVEQRKIQLEDAQKDYEISEGRYKLGVAKLSDVLQASVRLEQAKLDVIQAEGDFKKALSGLNSLIGKPLAYEYTIEGSLDIDIRMPDRELIAQAALKRPDIKQLEDTYKIAGYTNSLTASVLFPRLSAQASYIKTDGGISGLSFPEEKIASLTASWNLFELKNYFNLKSSRLEEEIAMEDLSELKRQVLLDTYNAYEDFLTATRTITVARQALKNAEHNFSQARGEYQVGKGDILSLVLAEQALANAREQLIISKLGLLLTKALIENIAGVEDLELLTAEMKE